MPRKCGHAATSPGSPERLYTVAEVAEWLGVSPWTIYHYHETGDGPNRIKFSNQVRYQECCVVAWLEEHMVT